MRRIPIGALPVFEAAARHLSFKSAANELNLSPSAVSHAMGKLEREIGSLLFDRSQGTLRLTPDGALFLRPVAEALRLMQGAMDMLADRRSAVLRLHSSPSFAAQWLTPRLGAFLAEHPGFEVTVSADPDPVRFEQDRFDVDIVYGLTEHEGLAVHSLGAADIQPMCTPEMATRLSSVADMRRVPLIRSLVKTVSWHDWFRANGVAPAAPATVAFDRSFMAIAAAMDGIGVCLEAVQLAERELASGRLVLPFAGRAVGLREANHFLVYPQRHEHRPVVRAFRDWLLAALRQPAEGRAVDPVARAG